MPADNDRIVSTLPAGLWEQPQPTAPDLGDAEPVQRIRVPAAMVYDYTPGAAPTRFLRGLKEKKILGERCPTSGDVYVPRSGDDTLFTQRTWFIASAEYALLDELSLGWPSLGIAGLYVITLQSGGTAIYRTQAVNLASDMADRIRANRNAGVAYQNGAAGALTCVGAGAVDCLPADMAAEDLLQWNTELAATLPAGTGTVAVAGAAAPRTYTITVSWSEPGQATPNTYTMSVET
jgi:type IV pilus modification protein PilV